MEVKTKEVFWLENGTWYPYLSSRGFSEPQAQWSPSLAAQPKLCCKHSPLPCFAQCIKNLTCLWSLLTEEDREHLNSHWCGKVGKGQQIPAGLPRFYFLSPWSIFSIIKEVIEANSLKDLDFQSPVQQVFLETSHFWKFNLVLTIGHL